MSTLAAWSYAEGPVTIWPTGGLDDWGQPIGTTPYLIPVTDQQTGGDVARDANGTEFVPKLVVYFEAPEGSALIPKVEWYIKPGDHTALATRPSDAERIRAVTGWPSKKFGQDELPDWKVMT
jgi:hypothetical protein